MVTALTCSGELVVTNNTPQCLGNWVLTQLPEPFELSQLDPALLSQMLLAGFGIGVVFYSVAFGIKAILSILNHKF